MCLCRCSSLANKRWQCGHGSVFVLVADAFLLTREPFADWEASIAKLALELLIDGERVWSLKAGDDGVASPSLLERRCVALVSLLCCQFSRTAKSLGTTRGPGQNPD